MNSVDITDLAFSLGNISGVNDIISSMDENITSFTPNDIIPEEIINTNIATSENIVTNENIFTDKIIDENFLLYLGIGLIIIAIIGFCVYNYYTSKNKHVRFQDNVENYNESPRYQRSEI